MTDTTIDLLDKECERVEQVRDDKLACGFYLRKTHGLLCAHELFSIMEEDKSIAL